MSFPTIFYHISFLIIFLTTVRSLLRCDQIQEENLHALPKIYYRIKPCYRQNTSIIARSKLSSFARCLNYAVEKHGLAFNFSPKKKQEDDDDDLFFMNCEVLGCPDVENLTTLVNDSRFDYYSLYGNTEALLNSYCIPNTGIFHLHVPGLNYSDARNSCHAADGRLAHIVSEARTLGLGRILASRRLPWREAVQPQAWDTIAYVGLEDQQMEGMFVTEEGEPLECFKYRAWAPGHPRAHRKKDDCVIIDDDKTWRAIHCTKRIPHFCEQIPRPPFWSEFQEFANGSCSDITNRTLKRKCKRVKKKYKKAQKQINYDKEMEDEDRCEEY